MNEPFISVIVPTYNRPERIRQCLQSLSQLQYPSDRFEVIVVDDGSPQPVDTQFAEHLGPPNTHFVRQNRRGPAHARNTGLALACGSLIAFTDDDCRPHPQWLASLATGHRQHPDAAFAGPVRNAFPNSIPSETSQILVDYCCRYFNHLNDGVFYTSNNLAFPTAQLRLLDGFDTTFPLAAGEDRELCARWAQHGFQLVYLPQAAIEHYHLLTFRKFLRQHFNYGRGAYHFHIARAEKAGQAVRLEPLKFYAGMLRSAFRKPFGRSLAICCLLGLSQAMTAAGYFFERIKTRIRSHSERTTKSVANGCPPEVRDAAHRSSPIRSSALPAKAATSANSSSKK